MTSTTLVWFRQDLRLRDNPALAHAAASGSVIPVYIVDDTHAQQWQPGSASNWWLHQSLCALNESLNGNLLFFKGDPLQIIPDIISQTQIEQVVWNRCYEPWQIRRDKTLKAQLQNVGIQCQSFNGNLLWEPWQLTKQDGSPYKVFTPFYKKCLQHQTPRFPVPKSESIQYYHHTLSSLPLAELALMPSINWYQAFTKHWRPGEEGAGFILSQFLNNNIADYANNRNIPSVNGTSCLSAHLHFGELSPHQVWYAAEQITAADVEQCEPFRRQLVWREFSYYLLYHFPSFPEKNFNARFDHFPWSKDDNLLIAWQQGKTGIPIIDAGMRELWQTGYMHNRVRMIVASFLVKNLLQDWREGAAWFWDCLLDADLANNSASWQWVAGSGADAAPYFRIFNPVLQGKKFDPDGEYVKRFCPELGSLPSKYIHNPWEASADFLQQHHILLDQTYPSPIVDLKQSRQRALDAFHQIKQ